MSSAMSDPAPELPSRHDDDDPTPYKAAQAKNLRPCYSACGMCLWRPASSQCVALDAPPALWKVGSLLLPCAVGGPFRFLPRRQRFLPLR